LGNLLDLKLLRATQRAGQERVNEPD
jgi:hypothetical protein